MAAKRNFAAGSWRMTNWTEALQRLHTPSNRIRLSGVLVTSLQRAIVCLGNSKRNLSLRAPSLRVQLLDKSFLRQLLERPWIVELANIDAFRLGIARGDVLHDGFHFRVRHRRNIANVAENVAFERAGQKLGIRGPRVLAENANRDV